MGISRDSMQESAAMCELEHTNMIALRTRIADLRLEHSNIEQQLIVCKENNLKEENKLRMTKSLAVDQLRLLQMDLNKIQSEFKSKQRALDDANKHRRIVEEDMEIKKRDANNELATIHREIEDESRKLNDMKAELRTVKLEYDGFTSQRRQLETEVNRLQEKILQDTNQHSHDEYEWKRRLDVYEKQVHEVEKKVRVSKEKAAAFEGEQVRKPNIVGIIAIICLLH